MPGAAPLGRYDCGSIMHYGARKAPPPSLTVKNPTTCTNVGQRKAPSAEDLAAVDYVYGRVTAAGAPVIASAQTPGQLDVFVADRFGSVAVKWVQGVGACTNNGGVASTAGVGRLVSWRPSANCRTRSTSFVTATAS
jgi:hypothetical protein